MLRKQSGITLIELLVVITIVGILAGWILISVASARRVARDRRRVGDVQIIHGAIQAFQKDRDSLPANLFNLVPDYLTDVPRDPQGANYTYVRNPCPANAYIVAAKLETAGVADAISDQTCWGDDSPDNLMYVVPGR